VHDIRVARPPGEPVGELRVLRVGPVATASPGVRNQSVAVVPSLPQRAFANHPWHEPG
jgi:hypothetical protein